jgi:hypothetical protein
MSVALVADVGGNKSPVSGIDLASINSKDPTTFPSVGTTPRLVPISSLETSQLSSARRCSSSADNSPISSTPMKAVVLEPLSVSPSSPAEHDETWKLDSARDKVLEGDNSLFVSGPGSLVRKYDIPINNQTFTVRLFDTAAEGYQVLAINNESGEELAVPFPNLSEARKIIDPDALDTSADIYETMMSYLSITTSKEGEPKLCFISKHDYMDSGSVSILKVDETKVSDRKASVECSKAGKLFIFAVTFLDKDNNEKLTFTTSRMGITNFVIDKPDLFLNGDDANQMLAIIPSFTVYVDPNTERQFLALYLGSENVIIENEEYIMTLIEHENEMWCSLYNPGEIQEHLIVIDGIDWINFKMKLPVVASRHVLFIQCASRIVKITKRLDFATFSWLYHFKATFKDPNKQFMISIYTIAPWMNLLLKNHLFS